MLHAPHSQQSSGIIDDPPDSPADLSRYTNSTRSLLDSLAHHSFVLRMILLLITKAVDNSEGATPRSMIYRVTLLSYPLDVATRFERAYPLPRIDGVQARWIIQFSHATLLNYYTYTWRLEGCVQIAPLIQYIYDHQTIHRQRIRRRPLY